MEEEQESNVLHFEPSAYLQRLIGRELISSEYIAVAELVKNAYDAGATEVVVELQRQTPQKMVISDNGTGMSLGEFKRLWMRPGYSEKLESGRAADRPLLGEKGIGRFAADRLARRLTVVTKKVLEDDALVVEFDWDEFGDRTRKMRDVPIGYVRIHDSELGELRSGTRLELEELRKEWNNTDWRRLRHELQSLVSPFKAVRAFKVIPNAEGWVSGEVKSVFEAQPGYYYTFSLTRGGYLRWKLSRPARVAKSLDKPAETAKRKKYGTSSFGPIRGAFYYVNRPGSLTKRGFESGVGIYRDGFRVEPYGRPADDWLEVKSRKAKRHGHAPITPSRLFGFVEITRAENPELKDVTNREGLLESPQFAAFRDFVVERFNHFAGMVEQDKDKLESTSAAFRAQQARMKRETRSQAFAEMASQLAHQLRQPLSHIRTSSANLRYWLERAGHLNDTIEQFTDGIERNVRRMDDDIASLSRVAKGLQDKPVEFDLASFVAEVAEKHRADFEQSGISLNLVGCEHGAKVVFSRVALGFILDNFLANALRAASDSEIDSPRVVLKVDQLPGKTYRVVVIDNGKGVPRALQDKLFHTSIVSESGQGAGLAWSRVWAEEYGGRVGHEEVQPSGAAFFLSIRQEEFIVR